MSEKSPLDFFSASRKNKTKKTAKTPAKTSSKRVITAPKNIADVLKPVHKNQAGEAFAILENIQSMSKDLERQIQETSRIAGKTPEQMEAILDASVEISAKDKAELKQLKDDLAKKIKKASQGQTEGASPTKATSKKKGKPTGDLRTKSIGTKRKWMPMK
jgi:hypothetical protein